MSASEPCRPLPMRPVDRRGCGGSVRSESPWPGDVLMMGPCRIPFSEKPNVAVTSVNKFASNYPRVRTLRNIAIDNERASRRTRTDLGNTFLDRRIWRDVDRMADMARFIIGGKPRVD